MHDLASVPLVCAAARSLTKAYGGATSPAAPETRTALGQPKETVEPEGGVMVLAVTNHPLREDHRTKYERDVRIQALGK